MAHLPFYILNRRFVFKVSPYIKRHAKNNSSNKNSVNKNSKGRTLSKHRNIILSKPILLVACLLLASCGGVSSGSSDNRDTDLDGIPDRNDNCASIANADQKNLDGDALGDVCDVDRDGDGVFDVDDDFPDNGSQYLDLDGDGLGHTEDEDNDGDGFNDDVDNCPYIANDDQSDSNGIDDATGLKGDLGDACELSGLNDTGQDRSGHFSVENYASCDTNPANSLSNLQDCSYGRDYLEREGVLTKLGAGDSGFDFTKLNANGVAVNDPTDVNELSYCVKDNVTGLTWEAKKNGDSSLINGKYDLFYWFDEREEWNAGVVGTNDADSVGNGLYTDTGRQCAGFDINDESTYCNTQAFIKRMNTTNEGSGYCGFNDWRLPTIEELNSLVDYGPPTNPNPVSADELAIDETYFKWTQGRNYWTQTNNARLPAKAWTINFEFGGIYIASKSTAWHVRLVRDGVEK
jgi:hypothetical protein